MGKEDWLGKVRRRNLYVVDVVEVSFVYVFMYASDSDIDAGVSSGRTITPAMSTLMLP